MTADRWASFDCYGTLVDWRSGIGGQLSRLWPDADAGALLRRYHRIEPVVQSGRAISYREVLAQTLARVAQEGRLVVPSGEDGALGDSLPSWPVFPEVPGSLTELRDRGWKLAIVSNTDPDLLEDSIDAIGVPVDLRIVASEIGSFKPAHGHWTTFMERSSAARDRYVHVAASLFHDIAPAAELGITAVWINRLGEVSDLPRAAELPDLGGLPDHLDGLVPR